MNVVNEYVYLGVTTNYDNTFAKVIRKQLDQGHRAIAIYIYKAVQLKSKIARTWV